MNLKEFKALMKGRRVAAHAGYGPMVDVSFHVAVLWVKQCQWDHEIRPDLYPLPKVHWCNLLVAIGADPASVKEPQPEGWECAEVTP